MATIARVNAYRYINIDQMVSVVFHREDDESLSALVTLSDGTEVPLYAHDASDFRLLVHRLSEDVTP